MMVCRTGVAGLLVLSLSAQCAIAWAPLRPASPLSRSASRAGATVAGGGAPTVIDSLKGYEAFQRVNHLSDLFVIKGFHHVELYTADATHTAARWSFGLGMPVVARSGPATGNSACSSVLLQSGGMRFLFSAPLRNGTGCPLRGYDASDAAAFVAKHGVAVRAVGLEVEDAREAYERCVAAGGVGVLSPYAMAGTDGVDGSGGGESVWVAEVQLYGDVVLRFVSTGGYDGAFLPGFEAEEDARIDETFGLKRLDHLVGNVWELLPRANYVAQSTGLHEFAEFTAEDVGTVDSGLNSLVLASNDGNVLLPMNEPTYGTR